MTPQVKVNALSFGTEMPTYEQHDTTWAVIPYDDDGSNSNIPKTYLSFVFRYRTRGKTKKAGTSMSIDEEQNFLKLRALSQNLSNPHHFRCFRRRYPSVALSVYLSTRHPGQIFQNSLKRRRLRSIRRIPYVAKTCYLIKAS